MFLLGLVCFVHPGPVIFWPTLNAFMWPSTWALFGVTRVTARELSQRALFLGILCFRPISHKPIQIYDPVEFVVGTIKKLFHNTRIVPVIKNLFCNKIKLFRLV